ncbi:hypothetical protein P3S68_026858 [Capsicum galapagoense]
MAGLFNNQAQLYSDARPTYPVNGFPCWRNSPPTALLLGMLALAMAKLPSA